MRLAIAQTAGQPGDVQANLTVLAELSAQAANQRCRLLLLPELYLSGYNIGDAVAELAVSVEDAPLLAVRELARAHDIALLLGYPGSPHYQVNAERRTGQGSEIAPDVDGLLCDCLVRAGRELTGALSGLFKPGEEPGVTPARPDGLPCNDMSMKYDTIS